MTLDLKSPALVIPAEVRSRLVRKVWQCVALCVVGIPVVLALFPAVGLRWERAIIVPYQLSSEWLSIGGLAAGVALVAFCWQPTKPFVILIHEFGHALAAALTGGVPIMVVMNPDSSGTARVCYSSSSRLARSVVALAGELAPGLAALGGAIALHAENSYPWLVLNALLLGVLSIGLARSPTVVVTCVFVLVTVALMTLVWPWLTPALSGLLVAIWGVGGVRCACEQFYDITRDGELFYRRRLSDSEHVEGYLGISASVVSGGQLIGAVLLAACAAWVAI